MPIRRKLLCHRCGATLSRGDRTHYLYQCHDCAVREDDLIRLHRRDLGHPDCDWLRGSPVDLGLAEREEEPLRLSSAA